MNLILIVLPFCEHCQLYFPAAYFKEALFTSGDTPMYNDGEVSIMPTEKPRFCITVDDELMKQIDDYRFANRYNSRSQATLDLIRMGLEVLRAQEETKKTKDAGEGQ